MGNGASLDIAGTGSVGIDIAEPHTERRPLRLGALRSSSPLEAHPKSGAERMRLGSPM